METIGGEKGGIANKGRETGEDVTKSPHNDEATEVIKRGEVTSEGNFGRIPGASDNSGVHPWG